MPWNPDGTRKRSSLYKKSSGFKMKSPLAQWSKTKIKDVDKSKEKEKTKVTGDKTFSMFSGNKFEE